MHRSGTSALARVLSLSGASLPQNLVRREDGRISDGNTIAGFWESRPLYLLHEEALASAGSRWDRADDLSQDWFDSPTGQGFTRRLIEIIESEFGDARLFVAKDPRISRLLPMWRTALGELGIAPNWVIAVRNPFEVAASLQRRDGFAEAKSIILWLNYTLAAERHTRNERRLFVRYDDLMERWRTVVARHEERFGFTFPRSDRESTGEIEGFLDRDLRHHRTSPAEIARRDDIADWVKDAFRWMSRAAEGHEGPSGELDAIDRGLRQAHRIYFPLVSGAELVPGESQILPEIDALRERVKASERRLLASDDQLVQLRKELDEQGQKLQQSVAKLDELCGLAEELGEPVSKDPDRAAAVIRQELERLRVARDRLDLQSQEREAELESIKRSKMWRLWMRYNAARRSLLRPFGAPGVARETADGTATSVQPAVDAVKPHNAGRATSPVTVLAFYLPQFHPIPENDEWWGKGFTEWTNVTRGKPAFPGHQQPLLPSELGFYDLRVREVQSAQAALARDYGIDGFCYHYYWFRGRKLLSLPIETMLASGEPDFPFCINWANENWTRRWDGQSDDVLLAQEHSPESDARFIHDIMPALLDPRYIKSNGKPLLLVYRADLLSDPLQTTDYWRRAAVQAGLPGLHLCAVWKTEDPRAIGFDALVEFPPHHFPNVTITKEVQGRAGDFAGEIFDYKAGVEAVAPLGETGFPIYRGVMPGFDNTARTGSAARIFAGSTPEIYGRWLERVVRESVSKGERGQFVFINAWNEWAEANTLEPSRTHGRSYLEATRDAIQRAAAEIPVETPAPPTPRQENAPAQHPMAEKRHVHPASLASGLWLSPVYGMSALLLKLPIWLLLGRLPSRLRWWRQMRAITRSRLFDDDYYLRNAHPDVARLNLDPLYHYVRYGAKEGLDPNVSFNGRAYLGAHPELLVSGENPLLHWLNRQTGHAPEQGRKAKARRRRTTDRTGTAARNLWTDPVCGLPALAKTPVWLLSGRLRSRWSWWRQMRRIVRNGTFDAGYYVSRYPNVAIQGVDPLYHYVRYGAIEGLDPNNSFRGSEYLARNPDFSFSDDNPLLHSQEETAAQVQVPQPAFADATPIIGDIGETPVHWRTNAAHARSRGRDRRPILIVSHDAARAGAQLYLLELIRQLTELKNLEIFLLVLGKGEIESDFRQLVHTVQIEDVAADTGASIERAIDILVADFVKRDPLMAICNTVVSSRVAVACMKLHLPVLSIVHELPTTIDSLGPETLTRCLDGSRRVLVVSEFVKSALCQRYGVDPQRLTPMHTAAFDWDRSAGWRERCRSKVLKELGLPPDTFLVLGCGSIHHRKGTDLFVQVAREALALRSVEPMFFLWIGADQSGPLFREWCEHDIRASGLEGRVLLAGGRTSTTDYFGAADALALTSREDPFPLVTLEAMARGIPVVAFRGAGGAPEALSGQAGIVVPYLDVREMARSLLRLCEAPNYRREISVNAARKAESEYQWKDYVNKLVALIEDDFGYRAG